MKQKQSMGDCKVLWLQMDLCGVNVIKMISKYCGLKWYQSIVDWNEIQWLWLKIDLCCGLYDWNEIELSIVEFLHDCVWVERKLK